MEAGKTIIRKQMLHRRQLLSASTLKSCSKRICRKLLGLPEIDTAEHLVLYAAFGNEVDLAYLIETLHKREKKFLLPRFNPTAKQYQLVTIRNLRNDTVPGKYGILEPRMDLNPLHEECTRQKNVTWVIPGVAFDENGQRLGRGGGYYDRLLHQAQGYKVGVAFERQITTSLPAEHHDIPMDKVVTEQRIIHTPRSPQATGDRQLRDTGVRANFPHSLSSIKAISPNNWRSAPITREVSL